MKHKNTHAPAVPLARSVAASATPCPQILDPHAPEPSFYGGLATEADHKVPVGGGEGEGGDGEGGDRQPDDFSTALAKWVLRFRTVGCSRRALRISGGVWMGVWCSR